MQTAPVAIAAVQGSAGPGQGRSGGSAPTSGAESAVASDSAANPYLSPVLRLDNQSGLVILQYRDKATGEAQEQIPSANVVRQYQERAVAADRAALATATGGGRSAAAGDGAAPAVSAATGFTPTPAGSFALAAENAAAPVPSAPLPTPAPAPSSAPAGTGSQVNALI